jgi:hypothetical protein
MDECGHDHENMSDAETDTMVVKNFIEVFTDPMFCVSIAPRVTCNEADTISAMLILHGGREACQTWDDCHADGDDDPDDRHHIPRVPDHLGDDDDEGGELAS